MVLSDSKLTPPISVVPPVLIFISPLDLISPSVHVVLFLDSFFIEIPISVPNLANESI